MMAISENKTRINISIDKNLNELVDFFLKSFNESNGFKLTKSEFISILLMKHFEEVKKNCEKELKNESNGSEDPKDKQSA